MDPKNLAGSLKVAILLQSMSDDATRTILSSLDEKEREVVSNHMAKMGPISSDLVEKVVDEFAETARRAKSRKLLGVPGKDIKEKEEEYLKRITTRSASLGALMSLDSDKLYELIKDEHP
ncbi:MAG: hypothetical protein B6I30_01715, partial [Desulfobacteraceae bacterium 4572_187]